MEVLLFVACIIIRQSEGKVKNTNGEFQPKGVLYFGRF